MTAGPGNGAGRSDERWLPRRELRHRGNVDAEPARDNDSPRAIGAVAVVFVIVFGVAFALAHHRRVATGSSVAASATTARTKTPVLTGAVIAPYSSSPVLPPANQNLTNTPLAAPASPAVTVNPSGATPTVSTTTPVDAPLVTIALPGPTSAPAAPPADSNLSAALTAKYQAAGIPLSGGNLITFVIDEASPGGIPLLTNHEYTVETKWNGPGGAKGIAGTTTVQTAEEAQAVVQELQTTNSFLLFGNPPPVTGQVTGTLAATKDANLTITLAVVGPDGARHTIAGRLDSGSQTSNFPNSFLQGLGYSPAGNALLNGAAGGGSGYIYDILAPEVQANGRWYPLTSGHIQILGLSNTTTAIIGADLLRANPLAIQGSTWTMQLGSGTVPVPSGDTASYNTVVP